MDIIGVFIIGFVAIVAAAAIIVLVLFLVGRNQTSGVPGGQGNAAASPSRPGNFCTNCGNSLLSDARFCTNCGRHVTTGEAASPAPAVRPAFCACGNEHQAGANFCDICGTKR